jgi:DNA-binding NtrC family response regulator
MVEIYRTVRRIANSTIPVLIQGETGVGKEVVARALHDASPRRELPFRCINCGAIPSSLVESVLFGHERGAFTGADRRSPGIFEQTDGGTVLLDEVGELSQSAQVALLRVIETKTIARVGGSEDVPVDVRVLAATHRNLEDMSSSGTFRLDLLYRLNALTLAIPPLRERRSEVAHLARHFLTRAATENDRAVSQITPDAIEALEHWEWPGNVRELRNVIDRAVVIATGASITIDELPERLQRSRLQGATTSPAPMRFSRPTPLRTPSKGPGAARPASLARLGLKTALQRCENALIRTALERTGANRTHTAELLGIPRRSLLYRLSTMNETDLDSADRDGRVLARWTEPGDHELRYKDRIHRVEGRMIAEALREAQGDRNRTAHLLGIQRRTLMTKLSRHGLGANSLESP